MGVAHTLSRQFFWSENILWKEDLIKHQATVFLCEKDSIINAPQVCAYLQGIEEQQTANGTIRSEAKYTGDTVRSFQVDDRLNVVWCPDLDHGQIFDSPFWRTRLERETLMQAARVA